MTELARWAPRPAVQHLSRAPAMPTAGGRRLVGRAAPAARPVAARPGPMRSPSTPVVVGALRPPGIIDRIIGWFDRRPPDLPPLPVPPDPPDLPIIDHPAPLIVATYERPRPIALPAAPVVLPSDLVTDRTRPRPDIAG